MMVTGRRRWPSWLSRSQELGVSRRPPERCSMVGAEGVGGKAKNIFLKRLSLSQIYIFVNSDFNIFLFFFLTYSFKADYMKITMRSEDVLLGCFVNELTAGFLKKKNKKKTQKTIRTRLCFILTIHISLGIPRKRPSIGRDFI